MKPPENYVGREQTYVKHFFLERYLERVAYNILSFRSDFVYVDGFSGPWKSRDEDFADTSFVIALNLLQKIHDGMTARGKRVNVRCLFIEKELEAYSKLNLAIEHVRPKNVHVETRHGEFEKLIPDIKGFIGSSFPLIFIDPTGWSGFGLDKLKPLLQLRGEVLINFMFDHINRFISDPRPETAQSFDPLFGGSGWFDEFVVELRELYSRDDAVISVYQNRLKQHAQVPHVISTRIKKPLQERAYFYLVYCTQHWKGVQEFRDVEQKAAEAQEDIRVAAKHRQRESESGMRDLLFSSGIPDAPLTLAEERERSLIQGRCELEIVLAQRQSLKYEEILGTILKFRLVCKTDLNRWLIDLKKMGKVEIHNLKKNERTPKPGHLVTWVARS